jgi:hypothetical protein
MDTTAQTAAEAYERYMAFLGEDRIIQRDWHKEQDGRQLACALGVLGSEIDSPSDCPANIMPRWLAQMVPWFFDNQSFDDAKDWGSRFYAELKRLDGNVPFNVVHDWHANTVSPLAIEVATMRKRDVAPHEAVRDLHIRALAGDLAPRDEWCQKLKPANANADAYADANAYANANANANANAYANANADAYADANANANANANADANAYAYAYADANANAYADAYADANANANADAYANAYANAKKSVFKRLADGMVESLARVTLPAL